MHSYASRVSKAASSSRALVMQDPLAYPQLLTPSGLKAAYDPSATAANVPMEIDEGNMSPLYSAYSPPPEDLYDPLANLSTSFESAETLVAKENGVDIQNIQFHVRSAEDIKKISCVHVVTDKISDNGTAVTGGLRDPKFGCSAGKSCGTCGAKPNRPCNGHVGHYVLDEPLFNVMYLKYVTLWLRLMCNTCGAVQPELEAFEACSRNNLTNLLSYVGKKCKCCNATLRKSLTWDREQQVLVESGTYDELSGRDALRVFEMLPEDDLAVQNITHPKHFITTVLSIPSICIRPAVGGGRKGEAPRGESDITYRLVKIVRANQLLRKKMADRSDPVSRRSAVLGLQNAYTGYLDSQKAFQRSKQSSTSSTGVESRSTKYKSVCEPLKGKTGSFRGKLTGKRVDEATRAVVAGYEGAHPSRLGVPKYVCEKMTVPIKVTSWNKKGLQQLIQEKKALFLTNSDGERIDLKLQPNPGPLQVGWTIDRLLQTDDIVLFNRQPTLSRRSIIALRVDVLDDDHVFRLPLQLTPNFNADFDGDEMNMHVPQTIEARAEAETLMTAEHTVINSASGLASIVPVQGDRLGPMLMSENRRKLTRRDWFACLGWATDKMLERARENPPTFPCKASDFLSLAFPENYNWKQGDVEIRRGRLICGKITKKTLNTLVHNIWHDRGTAASLNFVHCINRVSGAYNTLFPTTITFDEVSTTPQCQEACDRILKKEQAYVAKIMKLNSLTAEKKEKLLQESMSRASRDITEYVFEHSSTKDTGFRDLVESGSKGNRVNFCMVLGCLGKMLPLKDAKGVFTPPEDAPAYALRRCFTSTSGREPFNDVFVTSGYSKGMILEQYAVHSKAGRVGLIDSANKVGKVGYMYRRLKTTNEALCARNGMVIDSSSGMVISFKYGDDGRSPYYAEYEKILIPQTPTRESIARAVPEASVQQIDKFIQDELRQIQLYVKELVTGTTLTKKHNVAVSVRRVLHDFRVRNGSRSNGIAAIQARELVNKLCTFHGTYLGRFTEIWLKLHLHTFALWGMSSTGIERSLEEIDKRLWKCRVDDGEPVGLLLSSSFSAAATQVTLNSFHNIGAAEVGNFAALEELINLNKTRKQRIIKFKLQKHVNPNDWVKKHKKITLRDVILNRNTPQQGDAKVLEAYWMFPDTPNEFAFIPEARLQVRTETPFAVKGALLSSGVGRVAYAKDSTGDYIFHTDISVSDLALGVVVSGTIHKCRLANDNETVLCGEMPRLEDFFDEIDMQTVYTNDFHKMCDMYGIEAARAAVAREMKQTLQTFGVSMSSRHIDLLLDKMTCVGNLLGCTRHGLKKSNPDGEFVRRATFEQPTEVLTRAAAIEGKDSLDGPLARQVFGLKMRMGTYHPYAEVIVDKIKEKQFAVNITEDESDDDLDIGADSWIPTQTAVPVNTTELTQDPWYPNMYF